MKKIVYVMLFYIFFGFLTVGMSVNAAEEFLQMKNGDYSLSGFGSVTEELKSYGIDTDSYQFGTKENKALMMGEGESNIYIYIYEKRTYSDYDKISMSIYYGEASERPSLEAKDLTWEEYNLKLVSYDSTRHLQKYLIQNISFNEKFYHSIYVREIYNSAKRAERSYIFSMGFSYQFNPDTKQSKVDTEETILVTNKKVAYELYPQADGKIDYIWQRNYVAFSTDKKMDDLFEVKLKFNGFDYSAYTDIELNANSNAWDLKKSIQDFSKALTNKNVYDHVDKTRFFEKGTIYKDKQISLKNEEINLSYSNGFWWSKKTGNWSYKTIEKTSTLKENKVSLSDSSILDYDYVISFDNRKVDCFTFGTGHYKVLWKEYKSVGGIMVGVLSKNSGDVNYRMTMNPFQAPSFTKESITRSVIKDSVNITSNRMLEVEDLTLLEFHYVDNGEVKHAIAVDTYNDSVGGSQFTDNTTKNAWQQMLASFFKSAIWRNILIVGAFAVVALVALILLLTAILK